MKKSTLSIAIICILLLSILGGCQSKDAQVATPTVTPTPTPTATPTDPNEPPEVVTAGAFDSYEPMKELTAQYGFSMGTVINADTYQNQTFQKVIKRHFSSLSTGNEMKAYSLLDQSASMDGDGEPKMDFTTADAMVSFARDNGIQVRGHTLVWDAYMCDWFFNEGYEEGAKKVSRKVMLKRMESYIKQVVEHFDKKFPGTVYCWDVVNEAIGDGEDSYDSSDKSHIRTTRDGQDNPFYKYVGKDYVKKAFEYARKYASADTKLFYNDYNCTIPTKRAAILNMAKDINKKEKLIDGLGMQSYMDMNDTLLEEAPMGTSLVSTVQAFSDAGFDVQLTEMTVKNWDEDNLVEHGKFYYRLFRAIMELNKDKVRISNVSIWGLVDYPNAEEGSYQYNLTGTYAGILTENYEPKIAFEQIINALKHQ